MRNYKIYIGDDGHIIDRVDLPCDDDETAKTRPGSSPSGPNASSGRGIDKTDWFRMDQEFYDKCLDPRDYRPKK